MSDELVRLEHEWARIVAEQDADAAVELLAEDFHIQSEGGVARGANRDQWLAALPTIATESLDVLEADAREFGDIAVVRARLRWAAEMGGRDLSGDYVCADVFRRDGDRWRVVWRVSTKVLE